MSALLFFYLYFLGAPRFTALSSATVGSGLFFQSALPCVRLLPLPKYKKKPPLESDGFKCPYSCPYMGRLRCLIVLLDFLPVERDPGRDAANGKHGCDNDQSDHPTGKSLAFLIGLNKFLIIFHIFCVHLSAISTGPSCKEKLSIFCLHI